MLRTQNLHLDFPDKLQHSRFRGFSTRCCERRGDLSAWINLHWHELARDQRVECLSLPVSLCCRARRVIAAVQEHDLFFYPPELLVDDVMVYTIPST